MSALTFETIFTTDMRDSKGSVMTLVEVTGIDGNYTSGGIRLDPDEFGLKSIQFIGINNFFGYPQAEDGSYDANEDWTKVVDIQPVQVTDGEGGFDWRLVIFLYALDGAELPEVPMGFVPEIPIRMMILGSNKPDRD